MSPKLLNGLILQQTCAWSGGRNSTFLLRDLQISGVPAQRSRECLKDESLAQEMQAVE